MDWETYIRWYIFGMVMFAVIFVVGLASIIQYFIGILWVSLPAAVIFLILWFFYVTRTWQPGIIPYNRGVKGAKHLTC